MKLIIGAGFLGASLATRLAGKERIRVVSKTFSPLLGKHENIEHIEGDLRSMDWEAVLKDIDLVYTMNSTIISYDGTGGIADDFREGVLPMLALAAECKKRGIRRIIFPSSGGTVYGKHSVQSRESDPTRPCSVYAAHKVALENYFTLFNLYDGMEIFSLRIANPYGRMDTTGRKQGIIPIFTERIMNHQPIEVWGDGNNVRDYIHIDDLLDFLELVADYRGAERCFNVGTSTAVSVNGVIRLIERYSGEKADVTYRPGRICDAESSSLDISLATRELGWQPKITLEDGIRELADLYRR